MERGTEARRTYRAPGRVNLIGDHTDYHDGLVLPMAIDRDCVVTLDPSAATPIVRSLDSSSEDSTDAAQRDLERFVDATYATLEERDRTPPRCDITVRSDVPIGVGLSSSAALSVSLMRALGDGLRLDPVELACAARDAEDAATGVASGLMDQLASACGVADHALLIDCESLDVTPIPIGSSPDAGNGHRNGVGIAVVGSGVTRVVADSEYLDRRRAGEAIARRLGIPSLRHASRSDVEREPLARHVVAENARVLAAAQALRDENLGALGVLMQESHASLRDDYAVSTQELDRLVELLVDEGAPGARLTGAGFGGCVVAVGRPDQIEGIAERAADRYASESDLEPFVLVPRAVDGATRIDE